MKQAKRRVWSILLACVMLLTMLPASAWAAEEDVAEVISAGAESGTAYSDLQDAFDAADPGDTVKLLKDTTITPPDEVSPNDELRLVAQIRIQKDLTFDLNGKSIGFTTTNDNLPYYPLLISVENGAHVTFTGNGTIDAECNGNGAYGVDIIGDASLIVQNGTFKGGPSGVQVTKGTLVIYDGFFGVVDGVPSDQWKYAINCIDASFANGTARIYALGGTYCFDPSAKPENSETTYVPEGYTATKNNNGTYAVAFSGEAIAEINGKSFSSLEVAAEVAQNGDTITMVNDAQLSSAIAINKAVTLDLNGKTITAADNVNPVQVLEQGKLTIKDSAGQGAIKAKKPLSVERGSLILENGKISVDNNTPNGYGIYVSKNGSVTVNGGEISSTYAPLSGNNTTGDMNFTVNGGTLTAEYGPAIYMPGQVNLTITDGTLNGGISLRMGQVDISGGTINAITDNIDDIDTNYNYSGNAWLPDALYVFNGTYTSENAEHSNSLNLNITGGTFTCENGEGGAITIYDLGKVKQESSITISGEAKLLTTAESREAYQVLNLEEAGVSDPETGYGDHSGEVQTAITGGTYSGQPTDKFKQYLGENCETIDNGDNTFTVRGTVSETGVTLDKTELYVEVGGTETLTATVSPADASDGSVTWKSSDETVATVDGNGKVTGVKAGTATITATTVNGYTAECMVTVAESGATADSVTVAISKDNVQQPVKPEGVEQDVFDSAYTKAASDTVGSLTNNTEAAQPSENNKLSDAVEREELDISSDAYVEFSLNITMTNLTFDAVAKEDGTVTILPATLTFDVRPQYKVENEPAQNLEKEYITGSVTFRLPIPSLITDRYVYVQHEADSPVLTRILGSKDNGSRYVEVTTGSFSSFTLTFTNDVPASRPSHSSGGSTGGIGTRLPVADEGGTPSVTGFESDTNADLTVDGRYQFRITSLDGHTPVLTVNNSNFTVTLASQNGRDYFYVITCAGTPGSTAAVSVDGKYLLTATVGGSASGVVSDTTHPFTVAQGGTYQFRLTAAARPSFAAGSASFTVEYAGNSGNDWFYKVHAVGQVGDGCGFYINGEAQPVAVATIG